MKKSCRNDYILNFVFSFNFLPIYLCYKKYLCSMLFLFEDKFFIKENDKTNKISLYYATLIKLSFFSFFLNYMECCLSQIFYFTCKWKSTYIS